MPQMILIFHVITRDDANQHHGCLHHHHHYYDGDYPYTHQHDYNLAQENRIPEIVTDLLERVTLTPYADRVCGSYSGGNKRKLSLAIALVGSPAVVFLDEPSSGMDPVSRRHMWDIITRERARRSIVLTTHSMEECEALCTRIGIMTAGRLQCLGGQQHLKIKYGHGYALELRCERQDEQRVGQAIPQLFPGAIFNSCHAGECRARVELRG